MNCSPFLSARCSRAGFLRACHRILAGLVFAAVLEAAEPGLITGTVSNPATGNLLEGARVEVSQLGLSTLTDATGRYVLPGVPAGTHDVVATYIGLDAARTQVTVTAGQRAVRNFDLTAAIYQLEAFKVTGEREG